MDTSAVVACLAGEPERMAFIDSLQLATQRDFSAMNLLEARLVLTFTKGLPAELIDDFLLDYAVHVVPFDEELSNLAFDAYRRYGKGRHPAKLNMGDCAAYALARSRGWPLLYKGEDFTQTDIERA
ncbi:type II toxin-antitoxin system VapC family toxin [Bosea sp. CS1GBMeth4]|uniref:type II toxin-antitoxin system VapC family toxin n=1 Tax=Bosea sp. CS1GBMeth4 TaxID=1892849 RepID=UPI0016461A5E|nr:type II toxin-antitoxin system VapC family toxin [Bosea sp. CS1GBMeth4]